MADNSEAEQDFPAIQTIYANVAGARGGPFDLTVQFGYAVGPIGPAGEEDSPPVPNWLLRVAMSWEHARALHRLLGDQLAQYESAVGDIPDIEKLRMEANQ